ncbi:MAG: type II toxin-antitoxin system PemK/MazF family toxin [Propionibacteriaceae bacterium]|nr:type II toxin-antitoxin system PemK/MazF family toxin [Propionibacteriaceae bacterium]
MAHAQIPQPKQREVWLVSLGAARPGELGKNRPAVVVSVDSLLTGSERDLISVVPISTTSPAKVLRPAVPMTAGVERNCVALCDAVRAIVPSRFLSRLGQVDTDTFSAIARARRLIEWWDE